MAYTFGGATTDSVLWTGQNDMGNAGIGLVMGWWKPTTLTATRRYWSAGTVTGMAVDTTTSELRLTSDSFSGTDGVYTTTGAGITTNSWWFIAAMVSCAVTPTVQWKVWVGSVTTAPVEVTVGTTTAITTNLNGPLGNFTIGNTSGGSVAFQGDIDQVLLVNSADTAGTGNAFQAGTLGTITTAEAQWTLERYVWPYWRGTSPDPSLFLGQTNTFANHWDGAFGSVARAWHRKTAGTGDPITPTYSGVSFSSERAPRSVLPLVGSYSP